jgi:hypothetical protein
VPFDSVTIAAPGGFTFTLDDLRFVPAAVPEPASLALLALGTAALVGWRWRRRKHEGMA